MALDHGKPLLVMPRRRKYKEVVNDHQAALADKFEALGHILVARDETQLRAKAEQLRSVCSATAPGRSRGRGPQDRRFPEGSRGERGRSIVSGYRAVPAKAALPARTTSSNSWNPPKRIMTCADWKGKAAMPAHGPVVIGPRQCRPSRGHRTAAQSRAWPMCPRREEKGTSGRTLELTRCR